jgi:hypothetical protein
LVQLVTGGISVVEGKDHSGRTYRNRSVSLTGVGAWFAEGHGIVAIIAADDLTPIARAHVAQILGVPAETLSVEKVMSAASIRPDTEFREEDRSNATAFGFESPQKSPQLESDTKPNLN